VGVQGSKIKSVFGNDSNQKQNSSGLMSKAKWLIGASIFAASTSAMAAPPLVLLPLTPDTTFNPNNGTPTANLPLANLPASVGSGAGERAIWPNAGTVGGVSVDIVGVMTTATLNHYWITRSNRPAIFAAGQDDVQIEWRIYQTGTYNLATDAGGIPVTADVHVQFNDIDGTATPGVTNEEVFLPVCQGDIKWVRIDASATTRRTFGVVNGRPDILSIIGDKVYANEPNSGVEVLYPEASVFKMGRTANRNFIISLNSPSYSEALTLDYECADFRPPLAVNDSKEGVPGSPTVLNILSNDSNALENKNLPNNNSLAPSEYARDSVSLTPPAGATGVTTDARGRVTGFTVPGEGAWAYDKATGALTFTPDPSFVGYATNINYVFTNALGIESNSATVTVWYPGIGVTKSSTFNDTNGDSFGQVGETIDYIYQVKSYGAEALQDVSVEETDFTGAGTAPVPVYDSGDTNSDNKLDLTETWTFKATYTLVAADLTAGSVTNSATGIGKTDAGTFVSDKSDSVRPADGNGTGTSGPGPNNDDPTKTLLASAPIVATNNAQTGTIFQNAGATNAYNVLGNDTLNGVAPTPANVTLTVETAASNPGVTLDAATGNVSVAAGTPAGTYTIDYKICETANPGNCATATATVVVTAPTAISAAIDAPAPVRSVTGGANIVNALTNDMLNNAPVAIGDVNLTVTTPASNAGVTLDPATGLVSVAPGTPVGTYTIEYQICEKTNPSNCATSSVTVVVERNPITAGNDSVPAVNGATGNPTAFNAFANDTLNGSPVVATDINTTVTAPATPKAPGAPVPALDPATGNVAVPAGTPAGSYTIDYTICEKADPSNCKSAAITVVVSPAPIAATNDSTAPVNSATGGSNLINALDNDRLNGVAPAIATINLSVVTPASNPGVTLDPATGLVSVAPGTPAGNYTIAYQICERLNPANCALANITVPVALTPIAATNDTPAAVNGSVGGQDIINAFDNDRLNGAPIVPSAITATITSPATPASPGAFVPVMDPATGLVDVPANTPAGTYVIGYQICETANPANCAPASVTVIVTAAPLAAVNDTKTGVNGVAGDPAALNLFTGDTLNGVAATPANTTLSVAPGSTVPTQLSFNPATGVVGVNPGTPAGTYSFDYQICETLNPANCKIATASVTVEPSPIVATNDSATGINGANGATAVANAFTSDTINGVAASPSNATLSVTAGTTVPAGLTFNTATGSVDVAPGTPAGSYVINYTICETLNPSNCKDATITVDVVAAPIAATPDTPPAVNGATGNPAVTNAFTNDTLNGVPVTPATIVATVTTPASNPSVVLDPATGNVSVAPGTPAGPYTITYQICERLNPSNCATSTVTVIVDPAPIVATPDTPPAVNGATGNPAVTNAFTNDMLNGVPVTPATIVATVTTPASNPGVVMDPATGNVSVAPGTPAGPYTITYQICEALNPSNCATSTVTVIVDPAPIAATNDAPDPVPSIAGAPNIVNALVNDSLNGQPVVISQVTVSVTSPASNPGVTLDPATGLVSVAPNTPAGNYTIGYQICETLNPSNCATATVAVVVQPAAITAAPDTPAPVNGGVGGDDVINAFTNDMLNGAPVVPANITATVTTPAAPKTPGAPVPVMDPIKGFVDVPVGTPAGTYVIEYQICENLNPANCANSSVTVVVQPPVIAASVDTPAPVRQGVGNPTAINAFTNDMLNGAPVDPAAIVATVLTPAANPGVVLDPATGNVSVGADVPAGTYTIEYQICERLNPANCATSTVTVVVEMPISAVEGTVFTDTDTDGVLDPNEERRAGWIVEVLRDGVIVGTAVTNAEGNYRVEGLTSGPGYDIVFRNPENNVVYDRIEDVTLGANTTVVDQNQPIDPSGVFYDSVTRLPISGVTAVLADANGTPLPAVCFVDPSQARQTTGASGEYRFDVVPGANAACPVGETVYRIVATPPAGYAPGSTVLPATPGPFDPTGLPAPVRINPLTTPPVEPNPPFYLEFRLAAGDPDIVNNHIALDPFLTRTPLIVTKTSIKRNAGVGDIVPYEITVRNTENAQRIGVNVVDILPPGMKYVMGTSTIDGVASEPVKSDRELTWTNQVIPANGSRRYNLTLIVGAGVTGGEKVNTGVAENAGGTAISNRGTAVVSITPNAVFDCSELLGKVFEDTNRNGKQDENEPGVPGVRLVTVNGQLITTDEFGRYHIACAAVPDARIGSNFVLKVDTRTLPLGWDTTTDNPRSIRLTRGKFGELNFGVAPKEESSTSMGDTPKTRTEKGE
jgi:large repetitive protein